LGSDTLLGLNNLSPAAITHLPSDQCGNDTDDRQELYRFGSLSRGDYHWAVDIQKHFALGLVAVIDAVGVTQCVIQEIDSPELSGEAPTRSHDEVAQVAVGGRLEAIEERNIEVLLEDGRTADAEREALQLIEKEKTYGPIYDLLYKYYAAARRLPDAENILKLRVANNPSDSASALELAAFYA